MNTFIYTDDLSLRTYLEEVIEYYVTMPHFEIKPSLSTAYPQKLLQYLNIYPTKSALYILDVDTTSEIDGLVFASKIRVHDVHGKIIILSTRTELSNSIFKHKIEALDYIIKEDPKYIELRLKCCIKTAYQRLQVNNDFLDGDFCKIKVKKQTKNIPFEDIMFFVSNPIPHKMVLHTKNNQIEFRGSLRKCKHLSPVFYRCHKSVVVNIQNIKNINTTTKEIKMINGEIVPIASPKIKALLKIMEK